MKKSTQSLLIFSLTILGGATYSQTTNNLLSPIGKVGIGTMTPQSRLHVVGNTKIDSVLTARSLNVMQLSTYQGNAIFQRRLGVAGLTVLDSVTIGGPIEIPVIGDAIINETLEVLMRDPLTGTILKGTGEQIIDYVYKPKSLECLAFPDGTPVQYSPTWENKPNVLFTQSPCIPNLRVGIRTQDPAYALHVNGDGFYSTTLHINERASIGTAPEAFSKLIIKNMNQPVGLHVNQRNNNIQNNKLIFLEYTDPSTEIIKVFNPVTGVVPFFLEANGRMTIHNGTEKTMQLDPSGLLYAREIKVNLDAWPDYVFEPNYALLPLENLSSYINANKHLPGVPSACEMEEKGVNVAETSVLLMEKVEELTLYMIQLQEQVKAQEILINELQNHQK